MFLFPIIIPNTQLRGARHGLSLNGKLSRIDAQEQQMLKGSAINTETAQDIFKDWIQVKKKRKNRKNKEPAIMEAEEPESNRLNNMDNQTELNEDYKIQYKSKKSKKQRRDRDEDLANSFSTLGSSPKYGIHSNSMAIKKEKRLKSGKHRMKSSCDGSGEKQNSKTDEIQIKKSKKLKKSKIIVEKNIMDYTSSDSSETGTKDDPLINEIANAIKKRPSKKFKILANEITPIQKKLLRKSGLHVEFKAKKLDKNQVNRELATVYRMSKKIENLLCSND